MDFLDELGLHQLWEKIKGLISSQTSNYAVDSAVVHISGAETVVGAKTFSGGITVSNGAVISGGAEVSGRFAISSGGADFEIPSGDPNDATKFLRGDGAWAEITSAASADTITTTLPISLGGTGESTKNMAVSALFNDNVGSNAAYLLGATSTFASAGYVDANDAKALLGITQSDIVSMIGTEPVASASTATDAASLGGVAASNYVTLNTDQNITGIKTFVGQKKIKFQQSGASDKLGFTLYNSAGVEQGYLEYNPTNKINGAPLMTLGNYASAATGVSYVGFRKYSNITGSAGAYNLLTPLIADAKTPFSLTTTYSNFFFPLGVTDGTSMVMTDSSGVLDISPILPSGYTLPPATTTSIGGVAIGSGLDVTSTGDISVDSAYVSSAALDAVSSGGYITTSEASTIIADQISSGGYVTSSGTVASAGVADGLTATADSGYVHISGTETISGEKTFTSGINVSGSAIISGNNEAVQVIGTGNTALSTSNTSSLRHIDLRTQNNGNAGIWDFDNNRWMIHALSGGYTEIREGIIQKSSTTGFFVSETMSGQAAVSLNHSTFAAVWNAPTKNYRVAMATWPGTDDSVQLYSVTNANISAGSNTKAKTLSWNASTGALTADSFNGTATSATTAATAASCTGNAATATKASSCTGNAATATSATYWGSEENDISTNNTTATWVLVDQSGKCQHMLRANMVVGSATTAGSCTGNAATASSCTGNAATATKASSCTGNAATASSCTGNAATATTATKASSCTGNAATATKASSCTGNAATATKASSCTGNSVSVTCSAYRIDNHASAVSLPAGGTWAFWCTSGTANWKKYGVSAGGTQLFAKNTTGDDTIYVYVYCVRKT